MNVRSHSRRMVHGEVAPGFEEVERESRANFTRRRELGAACAIYHRAEKVVDLWGRYRDLETRAVAAKHAGPGLLDHQRYRRDDNGARLLARAAELRREAHDVLARVSPGGQREQSPSDNRSRTRRACASSINLRNSGSSLTQMGWRRYSPSQKPMWESGARHGYHHFCLGLYQTEIIRRVDPQKVASGATSRKR